MSKSSEIEKFESRFSTKVKTIAAVTGPSGFGAGKGGKDVMWTASMDLIAWKDLENGGQVVVEERSLEKLADDEEWKNTVQNCLTNDSVVKLKIRMSEKSFMLVEVVDTSYKDPELEAVLAEALKPVFYDDEVFGRFELDKRVKTFEKDVEWAGEEATISFDLDEDEVMKDALETGHKLFADQEAWDKKIREFAADELVELANDWLQDKEDAEVDEITKEMFMDLMEIDTICLNPEGDFNIYFYDGDMFWGHCIIVDGNINGEFESADIAG